MVGESGSPGDRGRSPKNRTLVLTEAERLRLQSRLVTPAQLQAGHPFLDQTIQGDCLAIAPLLPPQSIDLLVLDPPYNLTKTFNGKRFTRQSVAAYADWLEAVVVQLKPLLKPTASIYVCGDWFSSASIFGVLAAHFQVRNRITWEREKGRGAYANWKNASEDIWFCTVSDQYCFNAQAVKQRRRVLAPYRSQRGEPRDWQATNRGNFRDTYASNMWTDITIPFWSMPENTVHPTQKSEKLLAKLILASSNPGDVVLDPFLGSGTTSVVAKKLGRHYIGIEVEGDYCCFAEHRLASTQPGQSIQGLVEGVFWERNTLAQQPRPQESSP